jgi:hypothetical protein
LDATTLAERQAFVTTLVELERGERIEQDIEEGLKSCDIYVLLIGSRYSEWTEKEFNTAWSSGIPIKAYMVRSPKNRNQRDARKQRSFIELLHSRIRLQGKDNPYSRDRRLASRLNNDVVNDLAAIVLKGFHQDVDIRRIMKR